MQYQEQACNTRSKRAVPAASVQYQQQACSTSSSELAGPGSCVAKLAGPGCKCKSAGGRSGPEGCRVTVVNRLLLYVKP